MVFHRYHKCKTMFNIQNNNSPEKQCYIYPKQNKINTLSAGEIPSVSVSFQGSLTVEAAIVLPLFLFAMMGFIMLVEAVRFSGNMQTSLHQAARKLTNYSYAAKYMPDNSGVGGEALGRLVSITAGKSMTLDDIGRDYVEDSPVENGCSGVSFIHSSVMGPDQMIDLTAVYKIRADLPILGSPSFKVVDRARIRAFTGYDNAHGGDRDTEEEMVYVAEYGRVYHKNRNCSHLALVIRETNSANVGTERNNAGGKYYPCEYCGRKNVPDTEELYIAEDGDRWHTSITCPGLKRTIHVVPLSEAGLPPCSDCAR